MHIDDKNKYMEFLFYVGGIIVLTVVLHYLEYRQIHNPVLCLDVNKTTISPPYKYIFKTQCDVITHLFGLQYDYICSVSKKQIYSRNEDGRPYTDALDTSSTFSVTISYTLAPNR